MKHKTRTMAKRWLAVILCLCMIFPSAVTLVSAAEEPAYTGGPCEHHTEHTEDCGYVEAVEGQPCTHVHDDNCGYQKPTEEIPCAHVHDDSCGYQDAVAEIPCDKGCTDDDGDGNVDHQEGCAYQPAVEEQACTHTHDESCGYQAATEGSPCTHVHDNTCGYLEAVEGQPCTFVCDICSGEQEEQFPLSEDNIQITLDTPVGYVNQEYNLLDKATVTPEQDENGNPIQLRIKDLTTNSEDAEYEWNNPVLKVTSNENVAFTVTYEAYVELENTQEGQETEKVLATKQFTFPVYASGEIGEKLNGDFAYISDAYLVEDVKTESKLAIRTGTAPWDDDNSAGNDSSAMNNTVRSFDVVTYTAAFKTQVRSGSPYAAYKTGTVYYEFVVEGTGDVVRFETESMGWMTAKAEGKFDVTEETHDGKTCQVLRGSFLAEPGDGNPAAIGNSYQELNIALRVLAMTQGDTVKPHFTFWLEGNDVPGDGLVTGSGHSCAKHGEAEYKTIDAPDVSVTSAPRFNVRIVNGHPSVNQTVGTFDFSTGNELAQNKDADTKEGRIQAFGAVIQIAGKSPQHGLRGCELPDGSPITFDLTLTSSYLSDEGETIAPDDTYAPLLWSIDGNLKADGKQSDERDLSMVRVKRSYNIPTNEYEDRKSSSCFNGGKWKGVQNGETIQVTISDYGVDLEQLPYNNIVDSATRYQYYNPNNISGYWDIQTACFSAGEIWVVQPFYDAEGKYIVDRYGSGTFQITLEDTNLKVKGISGTELETVTGNSNQSVQDDDIAKQTSYLSKAGSVSVGIRYVPYTVQSGDGTLSLTEGCAGNGKDWILRGDSLGLDGFLLQSGAEGQARIIAADYLLKFDDSFFEPEKTVTYDSGTYLYGAKPDKTGWNHQGRQPDEDGYDAEMMQATADDLIFFSSLEELKEQGYTCVAILKETRKLFAEGYDTIGIRVLGKSKDTSNLDGNVFMITHSGVAWNLSDIKAAAAEWCKKEEAELTEGDYLSYVRNSFPSRADRETPLKYNSDYPAPSTKVDYESSNALKNYIKSQYNENGYVTGTAGTGAGDSCLVVDYSTQITKSPNQPGTDESGKKLIYDMDTSQREVDYVLYPTAIRSQGESTTEGTSTTTTVYIKDTLPAGLEYIQNSAFYGGTYTSNGGGRAGTVTGGQRLRPAITQNADGTTTLLFTLENVTITEEEITRLEPIYYSCTIGTPGNEGTDVVNQQELLNSVKIWSDDEQIRDFVATNGNYAEQSILISKNRGVSFSKTSDQKIVDVGEEMGFTIHHGNNSSNSMDVVDIDFLPHNEDGRGTQITGQVVVSELTIQSKELINNFKLYYTTETSKRNTTAGDYEATDFTEANGWTKMTVDADTGAVELPDKTHVIVAVAAVGKLTPNSTLKMHITFEVPDGKPGEFLVNSFGSGDMESNARTYIVNRLLEGVVWLDADKDGLRDSGETLLDGVKVTLMQKDEDGTYQPYQLNGKAVTVETGKQINVLTGEISDNTRGTGAYGFHHLPQGDFAVKFEDGQNVNLGDYTATQANVGTNDTIDSDAIAQEQDGDLVSASIEGIEMPEAKKITVQTYESRYHDLGLYASQINIPVEKVWEDNNDQDGKRPNSVTVALYADGQSTGQSLTLNEANGWKGTFENLAESENGKKINYTVKETPVSGYASATTGSASEGFTITNSYTPETVDISGSKTWNDNNNQDGKRPASITIRLYSNGTELTDKALTVTADDGWKWIFTGLPKYAEGKLITYTITEDSVDGYTSAVNGYDVTNTYSPEQTSITATKAWADNDNQDGLRPESVTVKLLADGRDTGKTLMLNAGNNWQGTFSELDKYENGREVTYTIEEVSVTGYETEISGSSSTGFTITNTHTPETVTLSGTKTWNDANDQDGKRPSSITIRLYANGVELKDKEVTVTADDDWKWSFAGLPKYEDGLEIKYTITEDTVDGYTPAYNGLNVTNTYTPEQTSVTVTKAWDDKNDQDGIRPESITVKLLADGEDTKETLTLSSGNNWTGIFSGLDKYKDGKEITYTIEEVSVNGYSTVVTGDASTGFTITNSHTPETISISGSKTWDDANDQDGKRPESITVSLLADGSKVAEKEVTASDNWTWTFENLPKYKDGKLVNYTIQEEAVPGYTPSYSGYNVTNSYTPGKVVIPVTKSWQDNNDQDGLRPQSVTVKLLADGKDTGKTLILNEGNGWSDTFTGLDEYSGGEKITYTIEEVEVNGYDTVITGDASKGFIITNSHTPETITISGSKTWDDANDQDGKRPDSITINLLANGTEVAEKIVTADDWTWSFTDLPKFADGEEIKYTITEDAVDGYTPAYTDFDVTNTYTPEQTSITVTKAWADNSDQDGLRPESITVKLLADGADTKETLTLSSGNNWTGAFNNLDKYRDGGEEIVYTIEEVEVSGYDTVVTGDASKGFVITNSHTPATTEVSGSKTWDDKEDQDGKRPDSITIRLYADGKQVDAVTVTAEEGWKWNFTNLSKYANGKEITYTITEDAVPGYISEVDGFNVTNSYTPGKTSVTVTKAWNDAGNQDGLRPAEITVKLLADGKDTGKTLTLSKENRWMGIFSGLDEYAGGEKIVYSIEEVSVKGYDSMITGDASTGFVITNSHTPMEIDLSGSKTWDDADDQDGKRPDSITIRLYANGEQVKVVTVTEEDGWKWNFTNLPKYENGSEIRYTITEDVVPGYQSEVDGMDVTNHYTPGQINIPVTKNWQDKDDQDGLRPQSVTVKLLADGKDTGKTLILSEGNGWSDTFTGLDEYAAGEKIAYTVEEVAVNGYDTEITGDASNGFTITNAHNPETITLSGTKTWDDADNQDGKRPGSITIRLYADGTEVAHKEVTAEESWKWSFADMPKYEDGKEITYTISEDAVDGYTPTYTDYNVTNTYTPEQTSVTVTKAWEDKNNQDGIRPESITVKLLANGEDTKKELVLSYGNSWTGTFTELDKYQNGQEVVYTIEEVEVNGYSTVVTGDASTGFTVTNSHTPATTEISGSKTWDDKEDQDGKRPDSITIRLYADGKQVDAVTVTAEEGWKWNFTDLPKYADGKEITYTITEDAVPGYISEVDGFNVTNSYTPGKTSVTVTKAWNDAGNQDGLRPAEITVKLLADGKGTGKTLTLSKENRWMGIFSGLDEYAGGEKIVYSIEEVSVKGYDSVITGDASTGFVITNSHTPVEIDLSGSKTWDDADDQDGKRPDSITIRLYANGEQVKVVTVTEEDGWKWNFTNLPKYENGSEIRYTITEDVVPGYQSEVDGMDVTNHYTPGQINIPVTKNWQDKDDADGIRPDSITVKLYADGKDTGRELVLDQENNWTGSFDELDEYAGGVKIVYTIAEVEVDGYDTAVSGSAETGFVITNSHTPAVTAFSGSKTWDDNNDQDGRRPDSITIRLYANGEQTEVRTVTAEDDWAWTFENLPKYENGKEIIYTITEDPVSDYQSEIYGMNVTNSYTPGQINIPVTKNWKDQDDADGIRPDSITVKLYANGKETGKVLILNQMNRWTDSFNNLDEYADGEKIIYSIAEVRVEGYEVSISGNSETGFVISNSHTPEIPDVPDDSDTPDVPTSSEDSPRTGDSANPALWISLLVLSGASVMMVFALDKRRFYRGKRKK